VPGNYSFDVLFSTGLGEKGELLAKWVRRHHESEQGIRRIR
jgi:hypothetical protein